MNFGTQEYINGVPLRVLNLALRLINESGGFKSLQTNQNLAIFAIFRWFWRPTGRQRIDSGEICREREHLLYA